LSEALPYIVLAGSVAAVFVGIGVRIALEESSEGHTLNVDNVVSNVPVKASSVDSVKLSVPNVNEENDKVLQREVSKSRNVGSSGGNDDITAIKRNESRRKKRKKVGKRLERKILRLYREGKSPKEIAEELGISTSTVYRKLRKIASTKKLKE